MTQLFRCGRAQPCETRNCIIKVKSMQPEQLLRLVQGWPGVTHDIKWGCDLVLSVGGKMFCVTATSGNPKGSMSFKVED